MSTSTALKSNFAIAESLAWDEEPTGPNTEVAGWLPVVLPKGVCLIWQHNKLAMSSVGDHGREAREKYYGEESESWGMGVFTGRKDQPEILFCHRDKA